jgi:hypothetical protein
VGGSEQKGGGACRHLTRQHARLVRTDHGEQKGVVVRRGEWWVGVRGVGGCEGVWGEQKRGCNTIVPT